MKDFPWLGVAAVITALTGTGGVGLILRALLRRRPPRAEQAVQLSAQTLRYAEQLEEDAAAARSTAAQAWQTAAAAQQKASDASAQAGEAKRELGVVRAQTQELLAYMGQVLRLIHAPDMTLERLRALVPEQMPPRLANPRD